MPDPRPLSDIEVHERLHAAIRALGEGSACETVAGRTTLEAASRALGALQLALLAQMDGITFRDGG